MFCPFSSSFCFVYSLFYTKNNNDEQPLHCEALLEFDNNVNINDDEEEGDNNSLGDSSNEGGSSDEDSDEECNRGSDDISVGESSIGSGRLFGDDWGVIQAEEELLSNALESVKTFLSATPFSDYFDDEDVTGVLLNCGCNTDVAVSIILSHLDGLCNDNSHDEVEGSDAASMVQGRRCLVFAIL